MDEKEKQLYELAVKYLDLTGKSHYYPEARTLLSDVQYLEEHANRTKCSKRFGFMIVPDMQGLIYSGYIRDIMCYLKNYAALDEKYLRISLIIFDIAIVIIDKIDKDKQNNKQQKELAADFKKLDDLSEWYVGVRISERLCAFIGCNYGIEQTKKYLGFES